MEGSMEAWDRVVLLWLAMAVVLYSAARPIRDMGLETCRQAPSQELGRIEAIQS
jgi:hypothetical protein